MPILSFPKSAIYNLGAAQTLVRWTAQSGISPTTNGATFDSRNSHPVLDFDDTTDESTVFTGILPKHYAGGGVKVEIHYAMTTATSGKIRWDVAFERVSDSQQDIDSDGFASAQTVNVSAVPGTSGYVAIAEVSFTDGAAMDSVSAGEGFRLKVVRKPSDTTNDTASGDAELWAVEVREAG